MTIQARYRSRTILRLIQTARRALTDVLNWLNEVPRA